MGSKSWKVTRHMQRKKSIKIIKTEILSSNSNSGTHCAADCQGQERPGEQRGKCQVCPIPALYSTYTVLGIMGRWRLIMI